MYTIGNMIPYVASYVAKQNGGIFNNGLVVWLTAAPFLTQGIVMPFGGMLAAKVGPKLVVIFGSVICR
nr:Monocarboxylate transporter 14 [Hymenolepis microstoma]